MKGFPTREEVERVKKMFPIGSRVRLIHMDDPYSTLSPGDTGSITHIDDIATVHVKWDCGSSLGLVYGEDSFEILKGESV